VPPDIIHDSAVMPVAVSYRPKGCWRWHIDYNAAHWHEYSIVEQVTGRQDPPVSYCFYESNPITSCNRGACIAVSHRVFASLCQRDDGRCDEPGL